MRLPTALTLLAGLVVLPALRSDAAVMNVPADHPDIGTALSIAVAGDEVIVAAGRYLEHDLVLPSGVVLRGATGDPADVVIDGERLGRCVYGENLAATTRIEALTLSNGLPAWGDTPHNSWGAGLMVDGGSPAIRNCIFTANETAVGGGAFIRGSGSPVIEGCVFDANTSTESCGLYLGSVGDPIVRDCVFRNGYRSMMGGGLTWIGSGHALIERCTVEDNDVIESGGGVEIYGATATLRDCAILRNSAGIFGGGLVVANGGHAIVEHCEIAGNAAPDGAEGHVSSSSSALLMCCATDLAGWTANGPLTVNDENCPVEAGQMTWGELKSRFR